MRAQKFYGAALRILITSKRMDWLTELFKKIRMPAINQVILIIIIAEFILTTAWGFLAPLTAVFITKQIVGGTVAAVGFAIAIYWVVKSVLQLFVARFIDKNHGEIDDFYFFLAGGALNAASVSLYYFATQIWHIYALHALIAVADAMLVPPFYAIFTRHIDKGQEGFEWSLYSSFSLGLGTSLGSMVGGLLATAVGFRTVFLLTGFLTMIFTIILVFLKPYIKPRVEEAATSIMGDKRKI